MKLPAIYSFSQTARPRTWLASAAAVATLAAAVSLPAMAADTANPDSEKDLLNAARVFQQAKSIIDFNKIAGNTSVIEQVGDNNSGSIRQLRAAGYTVGNVAYIYQDGNSNSANIDQQGGHNLGIISQEGNDHSATISQTGNNIQIKADISQIGFNSNISLSQSGSGSQH